MAKSKEESRDPTQTSSRPSRRLGAANGWTEYTSS